MLTSVNDFFAYIKPKIHTELSLIICFIVLYLHVKQKNHQIVLMIF